MISLLVRASTWILVFSLGFAPAVIALQDSESIEPSRDGGKMLDFEAEVIEGQRKSPQLFLQMDVGTPDLDAVMYLRQNFNDFHAVERNRKPLYRRQSR